MADRGGGEDVEEKDEGSHAEELFTLFNKRRAPQKSTHWRSAPSPAKSKTDKP